LLSHPALISTKRGEIHLELHESNQKVDPPEKDLAFFLIKERRNINEKCFDSN
jgi:hypothetical protein